MIDGFVLLLPGYCSNALIENGLIREDLDGAGSNLMATGEAGIDNFGIYFKPGFAIGWANDLGSLDFISTMTLVITGLKDSSAFFVFNNLDNGFDFYGPVELWLEGGLCKPYLRPRYPYPDMMLIDCV